MKKWTLLAILALAACASAQPSAREQAQAPAAAAAGQPAGDARFYRDGLSGVDFSGLDAVAKERALQILNGNKCDCGCGMTIAQCRVDDKSCSRSPVLAAAVVNAIRAGQTDAQAVAAYKALTDSKAAAPAAGPGAPAPPAQPVPKVTIELAGVPVLGKDNAPVTLVSFEDFQCPYCGRASPVVKQLMQLYPEDVRYAYKHYPLPFHKDARPAALAAIAAQRQNKFWEMHDLLYANQRALDAASLRRYAESLGLDMSAYDKAIADPEIGRFVDKETMEAQKVGVGGTPTFFVNGVQAPSWDLNTLRKMVDAAKSGGDLSMTAGQLRADLMAQQQRARANQPPPPDYNAVVEIDVSGAPVRGPQNAPVTIVLFSDFQCPYCAGAEPLLKQVLDAYPGKVRLIHKEYPLAMHPNARPAAEAAQFAKKHGKYWEMNDLLYKNYSQLGMEKYKQFARELGLDEKALEAAVTSQASKAIIDKDMADGQKAQVTGTPTIFVNGKRLRQRTLEGFKQMIDEALAGGKTQPASK